MLKTFEVTLTSTRYGRPTSDVVYVDAKDRAEALRRARADLRDSGHDQKRDETVSFSAKLARS